MRLICYVVTLLLLGVVNNSVLSKESDINSDGSAPQHFFSQYWSRDNSEPITINTLQTDVVVASLFYTNCPNTCNFTIQRFKRLDDRFKVLGVSAQFVLMSLDPKNDTPEVLKRYRQDRGLTNKNWHFLSSTEKQVSDVARTLGYKFTRLDDHVFHRMKIFLLDRTGEIVETVTMKTNISELTLDQKGVPNES